MKRLRLRSIVRLLGFVAFYAAAPAMAEIVVVVGAKTGTGPLAKEQVADIFLGKSNSLPGGVAAQLVDLPESSALRDEFYTKVTGKSAAQAKAYWAKLAFTGKGTRPTEVGGSADVKKAVAGTPGAIGYIEKGAVDDTVRVVYSSN